MAMAFVFVAVSNLVEDSKDLMGTDPLSSVLITYGSLISLADMLHGFSNIISCVRTNF